MYLSKIIKDKKDVWSIRKKTQKLVERGGEKKTKLLTCKVYYVTPLRPLLQKKSKQQHRRTESTTNKQITKNT